tara:strand:+ start:198 stop:425 length:228 start_codon:yes stop_codon:yes gene_type:complete
VGRPSKATFGGFGAAFRQDVQQALVDCRRRDDPIEPARQMVPRYFDHIQRMGECLLTFRNVFFKLVLVNVVPIPT